MHVHDEQVRFSQDLYQSSMSISSDFSTAYQTPHRLSDINEFIQNSGAAEVGEPKNKFIVLIHKEENLILFSDLKLTLPLKLLILNLRRRRGKKPKPSSLCTSFLSLPQFSCGYLRNDWEL